MFAGVLLTCGVYAHPAPHKGILFPLTPFLPRLACFSAIYDAYHPEGVQRAQALCMGRGEQRSPQQLAGVSPLHLTRGHNPLDPILKGFKGRKPLADAGQHLALFAFANAYTRVCCGARCYNKSTKRDTIPTHPDLLKDENGMLLKELSQAIGVSGDEGAVRAIIRDAIADHVSDIQTDSIGNLAAFKRGTGERSLRVMLDAHMDEVGFMVMGYDNDGMIRFSNVGGIDPRILPGARLKVGKNALDGVVLSTPIHHSQDQNAIAIKDLRIDIGATNKANAESLVSIGERIAFASEYAELSETVVRGKAFDNRVGCSLLIDILRAGQYPVDVVVSFSVQEEVGLRGARVAARRLAPDVAIALEGTTAHDVPLGDADPDNLLKPNTVCRLGGGPVLTVIDASMIAHPRLLAFMRQTATSAGIPYQLKTAPGGGTDAGAIHLSRSGVPSAVVSMPCRYIHSPHAYLSTVDYRHTLSLVQTALRTITPDVLV